MSYLNRIPADDIKDLMYRAYEVALLSPDPSTQNGALLYHFPTKTVVAEACNTFPDGVVQSDERWNDRSWKYPLVDHAEANVLLTAFRKGVFNECDVKDMTLICPWAACTGCTGVIIGFGLRSVITHKQGLATSHGLWVDDVKKARVMMAEAKNAVSYEIYDGPVGDITIRHDSKPFSPDSYLDAQTSKTD